MSSSSSTSIPPPCLAVQYLDDDEDMRYEILSSNSILNRMCLLAMRYPNFATLTTTQEWFDLPRAGKDTDCPFDVNYRVHGSGCNNYVLILHDKEAYPEDPDILLSTSVNNNNNLMQDKEAYPYPEDPSIYNDDDNNDDDDPQSTYLQLENNFFYKGGTSSGWTTIPDVFLSGAVHGNERVGPAALIEMSELLLEAVHCESMPRKRYQPHSQTTGNATDTDASIRFWIKELATAKACRQSLLHNKGITNFHRQWLARLVSTRRTIIIPTANALGYSRSEREESGIDPNRDFPFDILPSNTNECMQTIAARSINELYTSHLFSIGLTFHGGMEVIAYEWGAPSYMNKDAPDNKAQDDIASAYSRYANAFHGHGAYEYGTMNDKVYYVRGGMEDWAFAGSWDTKHVVQCTPTTYGGYESKQTTYNNSTLRAFNMLVETSDPKTPNRDDLGMRTSPLVSSNGGENGHIARNIRLALLAMDIVEPYISIRGLEGLELEDDTLPTVNNRRYNDASYLENSKIFWIPCENNNDKDGTARKDTEYSCQGLVKVSWTVGGAFTIDDTKLIVGLWDDVPSNLADVTDGTYPSKKTLTVLNNRNKFVVSLPSNNMGRTRWHVDGPHPTILTSLSGNSDTFGINPTFEAVIDTSKYLPGSTIVVFAKAKVDKNWLDQSNNVAPAGLGPTSHIVNSRRNPSYLAMNAGKVIRGKVDDWWYSDPITIIIGSDDVDNETEAQLLRNAVSKDAPRTMDGDRIKAVHINSRFVNTTGTFVGMAKVASGNDDAIDTASGGAPGTISVITTNLYVLGLFFLLIVVALALLVRRQQQRRYIEQVIAEYEDDIEVSTMYQDRPINYVAARRTKL